MSDAGRLEEVEVKLAHLERGLQELSDVVVRQQQEIESLRAQNKRLDGQIAALQAQGEALGEQHEVPPHY